MALPLHAPPEEDTVQRVSDLMGKTIVSADTGEKLGTVSDILLDDTDTRVVGLVVRSGWMGKEQVLPREAVQTLGRDAVVARSGSGLVGAREWRRNEAARGVRDVDTERVRDIETEPVRDVDDVRVRDLDDERPLR
jgi:uncharacterized protein YrrD